MGRVIFHPEKRTNRTKTYETATSLPDITYSERSKTQPFLSTSSMYVALWFLKAINQKKLFD